MSDKNKNKNFTPKVPQKPNFQLWLIVAAVMVLVGLTWVQQRGAVLDITQKIFNASNVEATASEVYLDVYLNNIKVGNINEVKDILIQPQKSTDVTYRFSFNPSIILTNVVNLITLSLAIKDLNIKVEGYVKVHSGFIYTTLPFSYNNNLKSILK